MYLAKQYGGLAASAAEAVVADAELLLFCWSAPSKVAIRYFCAMQQNIW
jgi:hypothetical protein